MQIEVKRLARMMYPRTQTASSFAELKKRLSESRMQTKERETEHTSAEMAH
jgi:hypothetical protein